MPIYAPDAEPLDRQVRVRFSQRQLFQLDRLATEFGMSRAWFLREVLADGLPVATERLRGLMAAGYRPAGVQRRPDKSSRLRGPRSDGLRPDRWSHHPEKKLPTPPRPPADYESD